MKSLVFIGLALSILFYLTYGDTEVVNDVIEDKGMYVIRATVYQIGMLTNETINTTTTGEQEAVTFYRKNGSNINLGDIAQPLLTNVTGQSIIGVAPVPAMILNETASQPWSYLSTIIHNQNVIDNDDGEPSLYRRNESNFTNDETIESEVNEKYNDFSNANEDSYPNDILNKRSITSDEQLEKNYDDIKPINEEPIIKIIKGAAVIPQDAAIKSISIPPLLAFKSNFSEIPVPIPNTSIVKYSKVNTVFKANNKY